MPARIHLIPVGRLTKQQKNILDEINPVFSQFFKLQKEYISQFHEDDPDCIFGYTEMSNVALLSTAAIQKKWIAVCEHQTTKRSNHDKRKNITGRADLYISQKASDHTDNDIELFCEAKQVFRTSSNLSKSEMQTALRTLDRDIQNVSRAMHKNDRYPGLGILFVPHYIRLRGSDAKEHKEQKRSEIRAFTNMLESFCCDNKFHAYSYFRPKYIFENWYGDHSLIGFAVCVRIHVQT